MTIGERLIPITLELSILASKASLDERLPMADAIIFATARHYQAQLITSDAHFANLPGVTATLLEWLFEFLRIPGR